MGQNQLFGGFLLQGKKLLCIVEVGSLVRRKQVGAILFIAAAGALMWGFFPASLTNRYTQISQEATLTWRGITEDRSLMDPGSSSLADRVVCLEYAFEHVIPDSPIIGFGTGRVHLGVFDDTYVFEWICSGLVGLVLFVLLINSIFRFVKTVKSDSEFVSNFATGVSLCLAVLALDGFASESFYVIRPMELFCLCLGCLAALRSKQSTWETGLSGL